MKKPLILLHGALGSENSFQSLKEALSDQFDVYTFNFSGHGGNAFSEEGFGIEVFAEELKQFIETKELQGSKVFGYSMGGYVALHLASTTPGLISQIITLGTKFNWTPENAEQETSRMNPELMEEKIPAYTQLLFERHGNEWKNLIYQTAGMMIELGEAPLLSNQILEAIDTPTHVMHGDKDHMVTESESKSTGNLLPNGQFLSLSDTPHPIEKIDIQSLSITLKSIL